MSADVERLAELLASCDAETRAALVDAASAAAFACDALRYGDGYGSGVKTSQSKPESAAPRGAGNGWARRRVLSLLRATADVERKLAEDLDRRRDQFDNGSESVSAPRGVAGRPTTITRDHVRAAAALAQQGAKPTRIAHAGILPARTFWTACKRGRENVTGVERELYLAVYESGCRS